MKEQPLQNDADETMKTESKQYLTFRIADETYAIAILQVKEILRFETITKVPSTPNSIKGVINLRGSVVPVVDLAVKFGLPESEITKWSCVVIVELMIEEEVTVMGVMADSVSEVINFSSDDVEPPPPFGTRVRVDYLLGMGKRESKFVLILDIDRLLTTDELLTAAMLGEATEEDIEELSESDSIDSADEKADPPSSKPVDKTGKEKTSKKKEDVSGGDKSGEKSDKSESMSPEVKQPDPAKKKSKKVSGKAKKKKKKKDEKLEK